MSRFPLPPLRAARLLLRAMEMVRLRTLYSPDQPRDEAGKWTGGKATKEVLFDTPSDRGGEYDVRPVSSTGFVMPDGQEALTQETDPEHGYYEDHTDLARRLLPGDPDVGIGAMLSRGAVRFWVRKNEIALNFDARSVGAAGNARRFLKRYYEPGLRIYLDVVHGRGEFFDSLRKANEALRGYERWHKTLGGPGSGNFGHAGGEGGPGNPGGSTKSGAITEVTGVDWSGSDSRWHREFNEPDDFYYHVTLEPTFKRIMDAQELKGGNAAFMGRAEPEVHSKNRVFLTERNGVFFWVERVEQHAFDKYDDPPAIKVVRIPKSAVPNVKPDEAGTRDARAPSYFVEGSIKLRTGGGPGSGNFGHAGGEGGPGNPGGSTLSGTAEARKLSLAPYAERILDDVDKGNAWRLTLDRVREGYDQPHVFRVEPKTVPSHIAVANVGMAEYPSKAYYDPTLADVVTDAEGYTHVQAKAGLSETTEISEPGYLYRGLSYEEWKVAQRTGELKSEGEYNIGEQQRGYTYFSTDAEQATHYASGFAPWQYKPSFDHPAIVVKIKDPGTARADTSTERAVPGTVSLRDIVTMYEGHPYLIKPGEIEFYQGAAGGKFTEGSRMSPSVSVVWKRTVSRAAAQRTVEGPLHRAADAHVKRIQVACDLAFAMGRRALKKNLHDVEGAVAAVRASLETTLPRALLNVLRDGGRVGADLLNRYALKAAGGPGSGNFGHVGRPGEIGGSGPGGGAAPRGPLTFPPLQKTVVDPAIHLRRSPNVTPEEFIAARDRSTRGGYLSPLTPEDLKGAKLYLTADGTIGGALQPDGDMGNLFNNGGPKGAAAEVLIQMIHDGGLTADCFDGYLPTLYANFGLVETGRMKFNRDYAPKGWNYERDGEPDVVFLALGRQVADNEIRTRVYGPRTNWIPAVAGTKYYDDYNQARKDATTYARGAVYPRRRVAQSWTGVRRSVGGTHSRSSPPDWRSVTSDQARDLGGPGSGNFGHAGGEGGPGNPGGSTKTGGVNSPAFKAWFKDSKVVDKQGKPLVVYHGGARGIASFDLTRVGSVQVSDWGEGIYFTPSKGAATLYAEEAALKADEADTRLWNEYEEAAKKLGTTPMMAGINLGWGSEKYNQLGEYEKRWRQNREDVRRKSTELADVYSVYLNVQNPLVYTYEGITDPYLAGQAKANGHDGIFIVNSVGTLEEIVVFKPTQVKSAIGNKGTFDPKNPVITLSLRNAFSPDQPRDDHGRWTDTGVQGELVIGPNVGSPAFKRWFKDSKVVDENGDPLVVYHGTTHDIQEFAPAGDEQLNPEADWGSAAYFSDSQEDVSENYAGLGPDLTSRIEQRADEIDSEKDREWSDHQQSVAEAKAELVGPAGGVGMPVYLSMKNPYVVGIGSNPDHPVRETYLTHEFEYDDPNNTDAEIIGAKGTLVDFTTALKEEASRFYETEGVDEFIQQVEERGMDGGISASMLDELYRNNEKLSYITDENGRLVSHELYRAALERAGFDGVIDRTVNQKFGSQRKYGQSMVGMDPGTTHYVVFKPTQIKSAIGNVGTFDPKNPIITLGGPGSGNFGHAGGEGGPGNPGGSTKQGVPVEPGTTPIPKGMIRGYHYTDNLNAVLEEGLDTAHAKGATYGEPNVIWMSTEKPGNFKEYVEVFVTPEEMGIGSPFYRNELPPRGVPDQAKIDNYNKGNHDFTLRVSNVPPERFVTHHRPWHDRYRYIQNNSEVKQAVLRGEHDDLLDNPEYGPAIRQIKRESERALGGPGSGNFGHAGRPGEIGGSASGGGGASVGDQILLSEARARTRNAAVYHGTVDDALADIKKNGLVPAGSKGSDAAVDYMFGRGRTASVFMTPSLEDAKIYAGYARKVRNGHPVILKIQVPPDKVDSIKLDEADIGSIRVESPIPADWIELVGELSEDRQVKWRTLSSVMYAVIICKDVDERTLGGPGSGNFGHAGGVGGPGNPGGSTKTGGGTAIEEARVFRTPDDIEKTSGWPGDPIRYQWKKEPGHLVTGLPVTREALPPVLYHVTTNAPAVTTSGMLLGQRKDAGLGGGQEDGVSFTTDRVSAGIIQRELTRSVRIARGDDNIDALARYADEDEKSAGLPKGALNAALAYGRDMWDNNINNEAVYNTEDRRKSLVKDAFNSYLQIRDDLRETHPSLKNPILFGRQEHLRKIDPANVRILEVPSANIPDTALITTGSDSFLHEVRAYSDVPVRNMKVLAMSAALELDENGARLRTLYSPDQPRDDHGRWTDTGSGDVVGDTGPTVSPSVVPHEELPNRPFEEALHPLVTEQRVKEALTATPLPTESGHTIGGGHANAAWKVETPDGEQYLFKPIEGEDHTNRESQIDYNRDGAATLAEREVLAAKVGEELGLSDIVPGAHLADIAEPTALIPPVSPDDFELTPPPDRVPTPEHEGVIATTIGGLNAEQRLDAWGRPMWYGVKNADARGIHDRPGYPYGVGNLVEPLSSVTPSSSSSSTPSSADEDYPELKHGRTVEALYGERGALVNWVSGSVGRRPYSDGDVETRANLAVFDTLIGNLDRHEGNYMMSDDDQMVSIDHGYSFPDLDMTGDQYGGRLRSFLMTGSYGDIPDPGEKWASDMARRVESIDWDAMFKSTNFSAGEVQGVKNRAKLVVDSLRSPRRLANVHDKIRWYD